MNQVPLASMASGETPDCLSDLIKEQLLVRYVVHAYGFLKFDVQLSSI